MLIVSKCDKRLKICLFSAAGGRDCRTHFDPSCRCIWQLALKQRLKDGRVSNDQGHLVSPSYKKTSRAGKGDNRSSSSRSIFESRGKGNDPFSYYGIRPFG